MSESTALQSSEKSTTVRSFSLTAAQTALRGLGRVSPALAARTAEQLFFKTSRFSPKPGEAEALTDATPVRLDWRGQSIASWVWPAEGEERGSVLLVHGWNGRATQLGAFVEPLRRAGYRVVAFDHTGHGRSHGGRSDIVEFAEGILAVEREHGPVDAIIAHSLGSPATMLALVAGVKSERIVLVAPPFSASSAVDIFSSTLGLDNTVKSLLRKRIERRVGVRIPELSFEYLGRFVKSSVLVVHDQDDREIAYVDGVQVAWSLPDARLYTTSGLGHKRILQNEDVVNQAVKFITAETV